MSRYLAVSTTTASGTLAVSIICVAQRRNMVAVLWEQEEQVLRPLLQVQKESTSWLSSSFIRRGLRLGLNSVLKRKVEVRKFTGL